MNPFKNQSYNIPTQFKSMFRMVAIIEPDLEVILRSKCIQYGVKGSNILATRLKTLYDLCQGSLMSLQSKFQLTIDTFIGVIRMIYEKDKAPIDSRPASQNQSAKQQGGAKFESKPIFIR